MKTLSQTGFSRFLAVGVVSAIAATVSNAVSNPDSYTGTLSPVCASGAYATVLSQANQSLVIASTGISSATTYPFLDCFGYLRLPKFNNASMTAADKMVCQQQADLAWVDFEMYSASTNSRVGSVPLDYIFGDAVHATAYPMTEAVYVKVVATAPPLALPLGCSIEVQYSLPRTIYRTTTAYVQEAAPRLHDLNPFIALRGRLQEFRFVRPKSSDLVSGGTNADKFFIASSLEGCFGGPSTTLDSTAYASSYSTVSNATALASTSLRGIDPNTEVFASWNFTFVNHGTFLICVQPYNWVAPAGSTIKALEIGTITVFGANPAFYTVEGFAAGSSVRLRLGKTYTFVMEGIALDLRPNRDRAKIVNPRKGNTCDGTASDYVSVGTDLGGLSDAFGHNITIAKWDVTFKEPGSFWVCYKRYGSTWSRVFPLAALSSGSQQFVSNLTHLANFHADDTFAPQPATNLLPNAAGGSQQSMSGSTTTATAIPMATFTPAPSPETKTPDLPTTPVPPVMPPTPVPPPTLTPTNTTPAPPSPTTPATTLPPSPSAAPTNYITQSSDYSYDADNSVGSWVALSLRDPKFYGQELAQAIADVLSLPLRLVYVSEPYQSASGVWEIRVSLACVKECNSDEKLSYLVWLFSAAGEASTTTEASAARTVLNEQGVQGATSESARNGAVDVAEEAADETALLSPLIVAIIIIVILLVIGCIAGIVVMCVLRRNRRKDMRNNWQFQNNASRRDENNDPTAVRGATEIEVVMEDKQVAELPPGAAWDVEIDPAAKP